MRQLILTEDGSSSLFVPELKEHYHSVHGAVQESTHIFIRAGWDYYRERHPGKMPVSILEAGFGTGLNAWLTLSAAGEAGVPVFYHSIEKYPLTPEEYGALNYARQFPRPQQELFEALHRAPWQAATALTPLFTLYKEEGDFRSFGLQRPADLVYYDAFNPDVQPHLWTAEVFARFYEALVPGGVLVTYCVKGIVKRALREVGFTLRRLPGPPGKREMLRAEKPA